MTTHSNMGCLARLELHGGKPAVVLGFWALRPLVAVIGPLGGGTIHRLQLGLSPPVRSPPLPARPSRPNPGSDSTAPRLSLRAATPGGIVPALGLHKMPPSAPWGFGRAGQTLQFCPRTCWTPNP